jgi:hypothetical protein
MNQVIAARLAVILSSTVVLAQPTSKPTLRQYTASDGSRAVITPVGPRGESRVEIYAPHLDKVYSLDFSSEDGEHGYAVAKAGWTADENFFVFGLENSGGHAPRHTPIEFVSFGKYSPGFRAQVCLLDSYFDDPGITTPDFKLTTPNSITTRIYGASKDVTVSLSAITSQHPVNGKSRCVPCEYAKSVRFVP